MDETNSQRSPVCFFNQPLLRRVLRAGAAQR